MATENGTKRKVDDPDEIELPNYLKKLKTIVDNINDVKNNTSTTEGRLTKLIERIRSDNLNFAGQETDIGCSLLKHALGSVEALQESLKNAQKQITKAKSQAKSAMEEWGNIEAYTEEDYLEECGTSSQQIKDAVRCLSGVSEETGIDLDKIVEAVDELAQVEPDDESESAEESEYDGEQETDET